ncbi:hypothetical protein [Saccharopolyspora sp. NPDC002376]
MGIASKIGYCATAMSVAGTLVAGGLVLSSAVGWAMPTERGQCNVQDLNITTNERVAPVPGERLFEINFAAKPGVSCKMSGAPSDLVFYSPGGAPLGIDSQLPDPDGATEVTVDEQHPAVVYIAAPQSEGPAMAGSISFNLPSGGSDTAAWTAWTPGSIDGVPRIGYVTYPVS